MSGGFRGMKEPPFIEWNFQILLEYVNISRIAQPLSLSQEIFRNFGLGW